MYDINTKNLKKERNIFSSWNYNAYYNGMVYISSVKKAKSLDSTLTSTSVEVKSYISDEGNTMYSPVYTYEVNGKTYKCESTSSSSIYPNNDNKTVYYDSKNPSNCMTKYSKSGNTILLFCLC